MIRYIALLTAALLLTVSCSGNSDTETAQVPTSASTATATPLPTQVPSATRSVQPMQFFAADDYQTFASNLSSSFQDAVNSEFTAIEEKAGISVAIYTDGKLWAYATGDANVGVPMTTRTPLFISSMSKTFLSAIILRQLETGLYKKTDSIEVVLSNHQDYQSFDPNKINPQVTIHELLTMSSGLPDYNENREGLGETFGTPEWKPADKINLVQSQFVESGSFEYNDTNTALLGLVAQHHSGQTLAELYRQTFFDPLDIQAITLPGDGIQWHENVFSDKAEQFTIPDIAFPYGDLTKWSSGFGNIIQAAPFEFGYYIAGQGRIRWACCEIVSTAESIAKWTYELYGSKGSAISEPSRTDLLNSFSADRIPPWNRPSTIPEEYGYLTSKKVFLFPDEQSITAYGHRGGGGGYSSWMYYSSDLDLSIAILTNFDDKPGPAERESSCKFENSGSCISSLIFETYSNFLHLQ